MWCMAETRRSQEGDLGSVMLDGYEYKHSLPSGCSNVAFRSRFKILKCERSDSFFNCYSRQLHFEHTQTLTSWYQLVWVIAAVVTSSVVQSNVSNKWIWRIMMQLSLSPSPFMDGWTNTVVSIISELLLSLTFCSYSKRGLWTDP